MSICFCASGCALNLMADPGVFGDDCSCWCHDKQRRKAGMAASDAPDHRDPGWPANGVPGGAS